MKPAHRKTSYIFLFAFFLLPALVFSDDFYGYVDAYDFSHIDDHADSAPSAVEDDVENLSAYLIKPAKNDLERCRALYRWITRNLTYDTEAYLRRESPPADPPAVLRRKMAVCEGYANLFYALADAAGIDSEYISGWAKGREVYNDFSFDASYGHAWNGVRLGGEWYLLDSTFGYAFVKENNQFFQKLEKYYFLTPPEDFIFSHFPKDPKWQLLNEPISRDDFVGMLNVRPAFFHFNVASVSHTGAIISMDEEAAVRLFIPEDVALTADLYAGGEKLDKRHTFVRNLGRDHEILVRTPSAGEFVLSISGKPWGDEGEYSSICTYKLRASSGNPSHIFPRISGSKQANLMSPLEGILPADTPIEFRLEVPGAEDVAVINEGLWNHLEMGTDSDLYSGTVMLLAGECKISVKTAESSSYKRYFTYTVEERKVESKPFRPPSGEL